MAEETLAGDPVADGTPLNSDGVEGGQPLDDNGGSSSDGAAGSSDPADEDSEKTLSRAEELFEKGSQAIEDGDFVDAVDCLSRALEIRVAHFGELSQECTRSYYKYGCALLYKAQDEADPLGNFPKNTSTDPEKAKVSSSLEGSGSSKASSSDTKDAPSTGNVKLADGSCDKDKGDDALGDNDDDSEEDGEDLAEGDEDESDLDLAWKMLDVARAIAEKVPGDTMEKVNILAALAEVSMEREDTETSLNDYLKSLSILERLVEPDNRRVVELNFRICLVLELGSNVEGAIPYCEKAIMLCKSRLQRLKEDAVNSTSVTVDAESSMSGSEKSGNVCAGEVNSESSDLAKEIELISDILIELEKKLEDLQQIMANPSSAVSELMKLIASKQTCTQNQPNVMPRASSLTSSQIGTISSAFDSPTVSTAATNGGVTHLGVVGRGIKRAVVRPSSAEPCPKKPMLDLPADKSDKSDASTTSAQDSVVIDPNPQDAESM